jgi:eukaryotic-like serine/threonine-protein kinase
MTGVADDETRFAARATVLAASDTAIGATIRATPDLLSDFDPEVLPRISLGPRQAGDGRLVQASSDLTLRSTLGEGGMGRVHLAEQRSLARDVAVKTLKPGAPPAVAHALLREARLTGMLEHPGVIPVHALGVDTEGHPVLVMKRVEGTSFGAWLGGAPQRGAQLASAIETLQRVAETLEFAHSRGVVHRDVKPENIMVGGFGEVYLLDWGIATTHASPDASLVGTPAYMAPEMVLGEPVDVRTDVYLLGATLHEVLSGAPRHAGNSIVEAAHAAMLSEPVTYGAGVDPLLGALANHATSRDPALRPPSAAAFRLELVSFLRQRSARAMAEAALTRVDELETALAAEVVPADLARAYRLLTEARFGLAQSLAESASLGVAREGMRRCLRAAVELELRQDHVESAAAILRELDAAEPALEERIEAGRARLAARTREQERLVQLERDLDPSRGAKRRTAPLVVIWVVFTSIGVYLSTGAERVSPGNLVLAAFVGAVFVGGGFYVRRNSVGMSNVFNRRAAGILVVGSVAAFANRLVAWHTGRPAHETLAVDLLCFALVAAVGALTLLPSLALCALPPLAGVVALLLLPAHAGPIFTAVASSMILVGAAVLARTERRS